MGCGFGAQVQEAEQLDRWLEWSNFWYFKGTEGSDLGGYARSQRLAEKVLERDPDNMMARSILGYCLLKLGPWDSAERKQRTARSVFAGVIADQPDNYRAHMGLGLVYYRLASANQNLDGNPGAGLLLAVFERAIGAVETQEAILERLGGYAGNDPDRVTVERELFQVNQAFGRDVRQMAQRHFFPPEPFRDLARGRIEEVPEGIPSGEEDPEGELSRIDRGPTPSDIQHALAQRLDDLLGAQEGSLSAIPADIRAFQLNLTRTETLLQVAKARYRDIYKALIDTAMHEFDECLRIDPTGGFFWVYEYRWYCEQLRGTLYDPRTHETEHWTAFQRACEAMELFLRKDIQFEQARIRRLDGEEIAQLQDDPWLEAPVEDWRGVMYALVNEARQGRQRLITTYASLLATKFKKFERALLWARRQESAELLYNSDRKPYRFHYLVAHVYDANRDYEIERYEALYAEPPPTLEPGEEPPDVDITLDDEGADAHLTREQRDRKIYELARLATGHYRDFLSAASFLEERELRGSALEALDKYERSYPGMTLDGSSSG